MNKSAATWFLDLVRHLLIIGGTVTVLWLCGTRVDWLLLIVAAIPVYIVMFYLVDLLTLPLFLLTPEQRSISKILHAVEKYDLDKALSVLVNYEQRPSGTLQASRSAIDRIRRVSRADIFLASVLLLLLLLSGSETVLDRLSFFDKHSIRKSMFLYIAFVLSVAAIIWRIWSKWNEVKLKRARRDIENILKKRGRATFERISRLNPKYGPEFLNRLVQTYPEVFRRTTIKKKKKPAIVLTGE